MAGEHTTVAIAEGLTMPLLGLGVWQAAEGAQTSRAVGRALEAGYRHIDTAQDYGNERSVGEALRASGVPREHIFLTTKFRPACGIPNASWRPACSGSAWTRSICTSSTGRRAARPAPGRAWSAAPGTA